MERLNELTITDVKELVEGKIVTVLSENDNAMSVNMENAIVMADPEAGTDGKIVLLEPDTECKIELDSDSFIKSIHGNENVIIIRFNDGMGGLTIEIMKDTGKIVDQEEM